MSSVDSHFQGHEDAFDEAQWWKPPAETAALRRHHAPHPALRILVVVDEEARFEHLRSLCLKGSMRAAAVHWLCTFASARDAMLSEAYDVVVADSAHLGLQLLREQACRGGATPLIVLDDEQRTAQDAAGVTCAFLDRHDLTADRLRRVILDTVQRASLQRARKRSENWWRSSASGFTWALRARSISGAAAAGVVRGFFAAGPAGTTEPDGPSSLPMLHLRAGSPARSGAAETLDTGSPPAESASIPDVADKAGTLPAARDLLADILGHLPIIAATIDGDGTILACGGCGLDGLGFDPADLQGKNIFNHPHVPVAAIQQAMRGTPVSFVRTLPVGGRPRHFECHVRHDAARGRGVVGFAYDVTDRIEAELARSRREQLLTGILRHLPAVVGRLDAQGFVRELEGTGLANRGLDAAALHGAHLATVFPAGREAVSRALAGCKSGFEMRVEKGTPREWQVEFNLFFDRENGAGAVFIAQDITARRNLERQLINAVDAERQRIGADLHDEVGQLLTGVACLGQALCNRLRAEGHEAADDAATVAEVANEALNQTRALSHGLTPGRVASAGLAAALEDLRTQVQRMHPVEFTLEPPPENPDEDAETAAHVFRIIQEAVSNAIRHGHARHIGVHFSLCGARRQIVITDDGDGFDPAQPRRSAGSGLGLMNYRALLIGGHFEIHSSPQQGTRIHLIYTPTEKLSTS